MAVRVNEQAVAFARQLIREGNYALDEKGTWHEKMPSSQEEDAYLAQHGFTAYGRWYLGIKGEKHADTKGRHEFPYGDFKNVLRSGLLAAESRAGQHRHPDIAAAAAELLRMLDERSM